MAETIRIELVDETPDKANPSAPSPAPNQPDGRPGAPASASPSRPSLQEQVFGSETPRQARQRELDNRKLAVEESRERREQQNPRDTTTDRDRELNAIAKREREKDEIFFALTGKKRERPEREEPAPESDPQTSSAARRNATNDEPLSAAKVFDKLGDVLTKSKQKKVDDPSGGHQEGAGPGVGHAIGETVGRSLRGFLQRSKVGRGALSLAANVGIGAGRGAAVAAGGAGGAAAGGAAGAGGAAALSGGPITLAIAGVVLALAGLAIGIKTVLGLYNRQGDELQQFSGAIYGARAEIESERLGSQIERAQRIGGSVAQVEGAQGQFNDAIYDLFTEIYSLLAESAPLSLIHISEPTRPRLISYAVFCL